MSNAQANANTTVNGHPYSPEEGETVLMLVEKHTGRALNQDGTPQDGSKIGVAVSVDFAVVPRSQWHATPVSGEVDIVTAAQGG